VNEVKGRGTGGDGGQGFRRGCQDAEEDGGSGPNKPML
jgi:hypothetical protein